MLRLNIIVCIKQVPNTTKVEIDPNTGALIRNGADSKMNPYDLYALELATTLKEKQGGKVTVLTMGPPSAREIVQEAFMLGADEGYILSDKHFAGADVLATSFTLSQGVRTIGEYDFIVCGKQTTDGDTAQVGPALAEHLGIPHVSWVSAVLKADDEKIDVRQDLTDSVATLSLRYPCLITVETSLNQPRLPSYLLKCASANREIHVLSLGNMPDKDTTRYGQLGSPTTVERIFTPTSNAESEIFALNPHETSEKLLDMLHEMKYI